MGEPFKEILAIIEQNKAKTEAVAELEKRLQNLQEASLKQYMVMQRKDKELGQLMQELQQNQERADVLANLEIQLKGVQEMNKQQLAIIQQKDREMGKLEMKLDDIAAKKQDKQVEDSLTDDYWKNLTEIQTKLVNLNQNVSELGDTVNNFDGKLQVEDYECPNNETMKTEHEKAVGQIRKKEEMLKDLKRTYESNVERTTKDNEVKTTLIKQLQQQVYEKSLQLQSAQTALSLSHERLALVMPDWMEKNKQMDGAFRN